MKQKKDKYKDILLCYKGHEFYNLNNKEILHRFKVNNEWLEEIWEFEEYDKFLKEHGILNPANNGGLYA